MNDLNGIGIILNELNNLWSGVVGIVPSIIGAIIVLIIGLIVAWLIGLVIVERFIKAIRLDSALRKLGLAPYFERAGMELNSGKFFGLLVYWFLVIAFVLAAVDILGLWGISMFLRDVLNYVPNIVVAALIMLAAVLVGNVLRTLVRASAVASRLHASKFAGTLTWWAVVIFGLSAALIQLGVGAIIIQTIITGVIAMLALAGGIAFGLGGKDYAAYLLSKLRRETERE